MEQKKVEPECSHKFMYNHNGGYTCDLCGYERPINGEPEKTDVPKEHCELPNGNYKYGEPYASGVRPVYGAHQQTLWYSVPNMSTRFVDLEEAENIQFTRFELSDLRQQISDQQKLIEDTGKMNIEIGKENEGLRAELTETKAALHHQFDITDDLALSMLKNDTVKRLTDNNDALRKEIDDLRAELEITKDHLKNMGEEYNIIEAERDKLKEENTKQGDMIVSMGKVLLKPSERELLDKLKAENERLKERIAGALQGISDRKKMSPFEIIEWLKSYLNK